MCENVCYARRERIFIFKKLCIIRKDTVLCDYELYNSYPFLMLHTNCLKREMRRKILNIF